MISMQQVNTTIYIDNSTRHNTTNRRHK